MTIKRLLLSTIVGACALSAQAAVADDVVRVVGADISLVPAYEAAGDIWYDSNSNNITNTYEEGFVGFLRDNGLTSCRVRLLVDPTVDSYPATCQTLNYVKQLGKRIKDVGMYFLLDIFYSDTWTDVSQQWIPTDWSMTKSTTTSTLAEKVQSYTTEVLNTLVAYGAAPDYIQIGNEISYGFLWDSYSSQNKISWVWYPTVTGGETTYSSQITRMATLLNAAAAGVRASNAADAKIVLHTERVINTTATKNFYQWLENAGFTDYDIIGLSYYPFWHGALSQLKSTLSTLQSNWPSKEIHIVETAYYMNSYGSTDDSSYTSSWAFSFTGQAAFIEDLVSTLASYTNVTGLYYWQPEECGNGNGKSNTWTGTTQVMSSWDNRGWWELSYNSGSHTFSGAQTLANLAKFTNTGLPAESTAGTSTGTTTGTTTVDCSEYGANMDFQEGDVTWTKGTIKPSSGSSSGTSKIGDYTDAFNPSGETTNYCYYGKTPTSSKNSYTFSETDLCYQTSSTMPAGTYTISCKAYTTLNGTVKINSTSVTDGGFYLFANSERTKITGCTSSDGGEVSVSVTLSSEGTIKFGVGLLAMTTSSGTSNYAKIYVDDFTITTEVEDDTADYGETDTSTTNASDYFGNLDFELCNMTSSGWSEDSGDASGMPVWTIDYDLLTTTKGDSYGGSAAAYNSNYSDDNILSTSWSNISNMDGNWAKINLYYATCAAGEVIFQSATVPAGTYTVSCAASACNTDGFYIFANDDTTQIEELSWGNSGDYSVTTTLTEAGTLTIGIKTLSAINSDCSTSWIALYIDNFTVECLTGEMPAIVASEGYATYYASHAYIMPEGLKGAIATMVNDRSVSIDYLYSEGDLVPACSALLIKGAQCSDPIPYNVIASCSETADASNMLYGSVSNIITSVDGDTDNYIFYKLSYDSTGSNIGFYYGAENGAAFTNAGGKCWLAVPTSAATSIIRGFSLDDNGETTAIVAITPAAPSSNAIYNLAGQRVNNATKGLYIINGKKVVK